MPLHALALKEEGTHPPAEGVLARFAKIRAIRSIRDVEKVKEESPDIVLVDLNMPHVDGHKVLQDLRDAWGHSPLFICFDSKTQPSRLLKQLSRLANIRASSRRHPANIAQVVRLLGVSQEVLSRILNVSARTAHRWTKGTRPRPKAELHRLLEIVSLLQQTLPNADAIRSYLNHPNPNLAGETPLDLLVRGEFDRVAADLEAVQEGVYV